MVFNITRAGKGSLTLETPVMPAAGTIGFADEYRSIIKLEKLGALVTNPVTLLPRSPANGTRVVQLDGGVLVHSGLPNPGLGKLIREKHAAWEKMRIPVILHLVATTPEEIEDAVHLIDQEETIAAIELGLHDDSTPDEAGVLVRAALARAEKPVLVRVPLLGGDVIAQVAADAGADGVVACAAPRGTARDAGGRLVSGRIYGPLLKPVVLRMVGLLARALSIPVIGAGGVHNAQDARDYLEAGARAVQVDSLTWIQPKMLEAIARDLGGLVLTQPHGAFADEWHPAMGETEVNQRIAPDDKTIIPKPRKST
jgi:dihydroorotate dehydrogenase (NAD+) catalytic subunit